MTYAEARQKAEQVFAKQLERAAIAKRLADDIMENNRGDQIRVWLIAQAILDAFEEGRQFEREQQGQRSRASTCTASQAWPSSFEAGLGGRAKEEIIRAAERLARQEELE